VGAGTGSGGSPAGGSGSSSNNNGGAAANANAQAHAPPPVVASSVVFSVGATGKVSAIPMALGGSPIIISGKGPAPTNGMVPIPIAFSSDGTLMTSTMMAPTGVPLSLGGKGSLIPVQTSGFVHPTSVIRTGSTGAAAVKPDMSGPGPNKGVIAGVVTGVLAMAILGAMICVCVRRSIRKRDNRNSVISAGLAEPKSPLANHIREFFGKRRSKESDSSMSATTPVLERGTRMSMQRSDSLNRQRASSEPASRFLNVGATTQNRPSDVPPTVERHRRSVSSVSGLAYPVTSETNNPFMDPDPNATLRVVNPDNSRYNTPATTPGRSINGSFTPQTPFMGTPLLNNPKLTPVSSALLRQRSPPPVRNSNPFADPVSMSNSTPAADRRSDMENPFADPTPYSEFDSPVSLSNSSPHVQHSRTRTLAAIAGMPKIVRTAPSIASTTTLHGRHGGSQDSGFTSLYSNHSPHMSSLSRFPTTSSQQGLGIGGLGVERSLSTGSRHNYQPQGLSSGHRRMPSAASIPRSSGIPGRLSHLAPLNTSNLPIDSRLLTIPSPTRLTPTREHPSGIKRLSETSEASSTLSIAFPSSWGEPGPTRPGSMARSVHSGRSGSSSEKGQASGSSAGSRVSDPFDLEVPEIMSYAGSEVGSAGGYGRSGSGASRRGSEQSNDVGAAPSTRLDRKT
jgi:hypothetical protein